MTASDDPVPELSFMEAKRRAAKTFERDYLAHLLEQTNGSVKGASHLAGVDRTNFRRLLQRNGLRAREEKLDLKPVRCVTTIQTVIIDALSEPIDHRLLEQQLLAILKSSIEDTRVPDAIIAHAGKRAGKLVTKTDAVQLEAQLGVPMRIRRQHGLTHVAWAVGTGPNPWLDKRSIQIAHGTTGARWPSGAELRQQESAYFAARDNRNEKRRALLAEHAAQEQRTDPDPQSARTNVVTRAAEAITKLREVRAELDNLIEHDQPFHVARRDGKKLGRP